MSLEENLSKEKPTENTNQTNEIHDPIPQSPPQTENMEVHSSIKKFYQRSFRRSPLN